MLRRGWNHMQSYLVRLDGHTGDETFSSAPLAAPGANVDIESSDDSVSASISPVADQSEADRQPKTEPISVSRAIGQALLQRRPVLLITLANDSGG